MKKNADHWSNCPICGGMLGQQFGFLHCKSCGPVEFMAVPNTAYSMFVGTDGGHSYHKRALIKEDE